MEQYSSAARGGKRAVPAGGVVPLAPLEKRAKAGAPTNESPFDAVLAAAHLSTKASRYGAVRIAPSSAAILPYPAAPKPVLLSRKGPAKPVAAIPAADPAANYSGIQSSSTLETGEAVGLGRGSDSSVGGGTRSISASKIDKGLRHFSTRVCAKVEEKGATTYNEVADELVQEIGREVGKCDHKNIRRRVYDALNVLMAIDIIRKDKKEIRWLGVSNETASEMRQMEEVIAATEKRVKEKRKAMSELVQRLVALKNLIGRNSLSAGSSAEGVPSTAGHAGTNSNRSTNTNPDTHPHTNTSTSTVSDRLQLPFILINAPRDCRVHCEMLEDRSQYFFEFDSPFLINEDIELLRLMNLDRASEGELLSWLPLEAVQFYMDSTQTATPWQALQPPIDMGILGLDEWAPQQAAVEQYLESMPPAIGGLAGFDLEDIAAPPMVMSSPVRHSIRANPPATGTLGRSVRPFRPALNGSSFRATIGK